MDKLFIQNLVVPAVIGVYAEERHAPQSLGVDVEMTYDASLAAKTDALSDALDYAAVCAVVREVAGATAFQLVESLAEQLATTLKSHFSIAHCVVTVRKKPKDLPDVSAVGITIAR